MNRQQSSHYADPLAYLQQDISRLGQLFGEENRIKALKVSKSRHLRQHSDPELKLPPISQSQGSRGNSHAKDNQTMMQKLSNYEQRIMSLQKQKQVLSRKNQKITNQIIRSRYVTSFYGPRQDDQDDRPVLETAIPKKSRFSTKSQHDINSIGKHQKPKKPAFDKIKLRKLVKKMKSVFRAVYFCIVFPKFARTLTLDRYDNFKRSHKDDKNYKDLTLMISENLRGLFNFDIFQSKSVNHLGQIRSRAKLDETTRSRIKNNKNFMNQKQPRNKKKATQTKQKKQVSIISQSIISYQISLKLDKSVSFVILFIGQVRQAVSNVNFLQLMKQFVSFLPYEFVPSGICSESELQLLNIHSQKLYARHTKQVAVYLMLKFLLVNVIVERNLMYSWGVKKQVEENLDASEQKSNQLYFAYRIRSIILEKFVQQYLEGKEKQFNHYSLGSKIKRKLSKISRQESESDNVHEYKNLNIPQQDFISEIEAQTTKRFGQTSLIFKEIGQILYSFYWKTQQQQFSRVKEGSLQKKFRKQGVQYFHSFPKETKLN